MKFRVTGFVVVMLQLSIAPGNQAWLDIPYVKQDKNGCGAASISMVLQYWENHGSTLPAKAADVRRILQRLYSNEAKGIFGSDMQEYFKDVGFETYIFKAEWSDLLNHLSKGRPLIVCLKENQKEASNHFVVVAGVAPSDNVVLINDPAGRKLQKIGEAEFRKSWSLTWNWTLLALPH